MFGYSVRLRVDRNLFSIYLMAKQRLRAELDFVPKIYVIRLFLKLIVYLNMVVVSITSDIFLSVRYKL